MACYRGKAAPNLQTKFELFSESAGFCQNSSCQKELFIQGKKKRFNIAEIAHVFAASDVGPRGDPQLSKLDRGSKDNLILLCPTCHTIVDKDADAYTEAVIRGWKSEHHIKIHKIFGVERFDNRATLRSFIEPLMLENHAIHKIYGPDTIKDQGPETDLSDVWKTKMLLNIIPNNRKILSALDLNRSLLTTAELQALEPFRLHLADLERRHILKDGRGGGARYPAEMADMAKD